MCLSSGSIKCISATSICVGRQHLSQAIRPFKSFRERFMWATFSPFVAHSTQIAQYINGWIFHKSIRQPRVQAMKVSHEWLRNGMNNNKDINSVITSILISVFNTCLKKTLSMVSQQHNKHPLHVWNYEWRNHLVSLYEELWLGLGIPAVSWMCESLFTIQFRA